MKFLGLAKEKYVAIFISYLLSVLSLKTSLNTITAALIGPGVTWDTMLIEGLFYFLLIATFAMNKLKLNGRIIVFLLFFISAGTVTMFIEPEIAVYIYGRVGTPFLSKPIVVFCVYCFTGFVAAAYLEDMEYFFDVFEKFSYVTVIFGILCYYFSLGMKDALQYMTFSYDMLLQVTFLSLRCLNKFRVRRLICAVAGIITIFISGCRGALAACLACILLYALMMPTKQPAKKLFVWFVLAIIALLIYNNFDSFINWVAKFLEQNNIESRTVRLILEGEIDNDSGRSMVQEQVRTGFSLFGRGLYSDRILTGGRYAHNIAIELISDFGIIFGSLFFAGLCITVMLGYLRADSKMKILICALLSTGFFKFFLSSSFLMPEPSLYVLISLCITIIKNKKHTKIN